MFKFKGSKNQQSNTEIAKSVEDLFAFSKISTLGFPYKPTALAWEPHLHLMGIGTEYGSLRIYGAPGVQFCGELRQKIAILKIIFIPKKARLICLCSDNSLHLWELNDKNSIWSLEEIKSFVLVGLMKKITVITLNAASDILYLGTMCGNIYTLNVETFEIADTVIYQDVVVQNVPDDKKLKQGAVKIISSQPSKPECLLIGYQQGLIALWDVQKLLVTNTFITNQSLESISWFNGLKFMSSHTDGSYVMWDTMNSSKPIQVPMTPYGPFSCKAIEKVLWSSVKGGDDFIIFSGGMQRSSFGEKFTLTIMCGDKHEVFDLTSKVIDFFTISDSFDECEFENPHSLIILLEEELIAVDLETELWLPFKFPYLEVPHSSPVTCYQYVTDVHKDMWSMLTEFSQQQTSTDFSEREWPINGGKIIPDSSLPNNILVTGHENGGVRIWNATPTSLQLMLTFQTSEVFVSYEADNSSDDAVEEWPPFRKMGNFDSLLDDPRFAIRSVALNDSSRTLIASGTAGQVIVLQLQNTEAERETYVSHLTLSDKGDNSSWCNSQPLVVRAGKQRYSKGFHVHCVVQLAPAAPVTSSALYAEWNLFAVGTMHGFLLYDVTQKKSVLTRYTLNVSDGASILSNVSPKTKSLRRSFRESFRKLKMGRTKSWKKERTESLNSDSVQEDIPSSRENSFKRNSFTSSPDPTLSGSTSAEIRSFEGDGECTSGDVMNSVQCLYFSQSFIINNVITTPTLWVGTSSGSIYIYTITLPAHDSRATEAVTCQLGKEVHLKHQAPVIGIRIMDHRGYPLPDPTDVQHQRCKPADLCGSHKVLICTEEQIKVFTLPSMKPYVKHKVSVVEGYSISKVGFSTFPNKTDAKSSEYCILCVSRSNGITLYSMPELKRFISYNYCALEDTEFLSKIVFTHNGVLVCMNSCSEFEVVSLSPVASAKPACCIELPEGARTPLVPIENIVLQMRDIGSQNGPESGDGCNNFPNIDQLSQNPQSDAENSADQMRQNTEALNNQSESSTDNPHRAVDTLSDSLSPNVQHLRAPLAVIDELNSSDESQLNTSMNSASVELL